MMKKLAFLAAAALMALPGAAQSTQKLSASKANDYGIVYSLPQTTLQITIEAERTVRTPGEFYKYALRYLGTTEAVSVASEQWRLLSVTVVPKGLPQTSADTYLMQFKSGSNPFMLLTADGLPLALNTERVVEAEEPELPTARAAAPTALEGPAARQAVTEEMLQSSSMAKRAELAAAQIMAIRQSRNDYLTGQADQMPDGTALQLILKNLNAQEEALTAMFLGTEQVSTEVVTLTYTPADAVTNAVIARLSATEGIVDADDLRGAPITLSVTVNDRGTMPVNDKGEAKKMPKGAVAYNIPGTATVTVSYDGRTFASEQVSVAQFGVTYGLDPAIFTDKKAPAYVIFDPTTGGIRELGH